MKTRTITKDEAHEIGLSVFVHLVDLDKDADRDYPAIIKGYKNEPLTGLLVLIEAENRYYWLPPNRLFVEDNSPNGEKGSVMELGEREKRQKEVYTKIADRLLTHLDDLVDDKVVINFAEFNDALESVAWLESEIDRFEEMEAFVQENPRDFLPMRNPVRRVRRRR